MLNFTRATTTFYQFMNINIILQIYNAILIKYSNLPQVCYIPHRQICVDIPDHSRGAIILSVSLSDHVYLMSSMILYMTILCHYASGCAIMQE